MKVVSRLFGTENRGLKLLSGLFAFLVWCSVGADSEREQSFRMRVTVRDIPSGWVLMDEPDDIVVTVRGRERVLKGLSVESMRVAEIGPLAPGQRMWQVRPSDLDLPDGLSVRSITPSDIPLRLEERVTSTVAVSLALRGSVPAGYELLSHRVVPDRIEISAPSSYFPELSSIDTETIDLDGMIQNPRRRVTLAPQRPFIHWDRDTAFIAEIQIAVIEQEQVFNEVILLPTGGAAERCTLGHPNVQVRLRGPRAILTGLNPATLFASLDCGDARRDAGAFIGEPTLHNIPAALRILDLAPATVRFTIADLPPVPQEEPTPPLDPPEAEGEGETEQEEPPPHSP